MGRLIIWIGLAFVLSAPPVAGSDGLILQKASGFFRVADEIGRSVTHIEQVTAHARDDIFLVFIPGILGSKLTDPRTGKVIWGHEVRPSVQDLLLRPGDGPAYAEVLQTYPHPLGLFRSDVYGRFDDELLAMLGGRAGQKREFAYDWRQDLRSTAALLDDRLRGEWSSLVRGRKLVLVGHSMGGLVAWAWKEFFYSRTVYDFTLYRLILLGSPLEGSCDLLRLLLVGYRPYDGASTLENQVYNFLFSELHPAAFTFPSVFQLLPAVPGHLNPDSDSTCLVVQMGGNRRGLDYFELATWREFLREIIDNGRKTPWEKLRMDKESFWYMVAEALKEGKGFREALNFREVSLRGRIDYFYSRSYPTISQVHVVKRKETSLAKSETRLGDGRVLMDSATLYRRVGTLPRRVESSHGGLVRDTGFLDYLREFLDCEAIGKIAVAIARDPTALRLYATRGGLIPLCGVVDVWETKQLDEVSRAILRLNESVLKNLIATRRLASERSLYQHAKSIEGQVGKDVASVVYEVAFATGAVPADEMMFALNRYGLCLLQTGRRNEAVNPLRRAVEEVESGTRQYPRGDVAELFNNLGTAYRGIGVIDDAEQAFERAVALGSDKARRSLKEIRSGKK